MSSVSLLKQFISLRSLYPQMSVLFIAQALLLTSNVTFIAVNGLAGASLASHAMLSTLPIAFQALASAVSSYPSSLLMQRYGRRTGFTVGGIFGVVGSLLAAWGMASQQLALLCAGTFLAGVYNGMGQYLRFAAADTAQCYRPSFKAQAIAIVLAGGVFGGIIGPETAKWSRGLYDTVFLGTYLSLAVFSCVAVVVVQFVRIPNAASAAASPAVPATVELTKTIQTPGTSNPLSHLSVKQILSQPTVFTAVLCGAVAYGVMNLLMVATPLAMQVCGYSFNQTAWVIEWHVIAMFAPGFVTGQLNNRFGVTRIMAAGCALMLCAASINIMGTGLWHFWCALLLLGLGWNWLFTGATTLLTSAYNETNKARVQGINDTIVFGTLVLSSLSSGVLVSQYGWLLMNVVSIPVIGLALWSLFRLKKLKALSL